MRLSNEHRKQIVGLVQQIGGSNCRVRLFGSRLDDSAKGGDVDLLLECETDVRQPALLAARLSAGVSRIIQGRKVDVVVSAPNLKRLPIHEIASREGVLL